MPKPPSRTRQEQLADALQALATVQQEGVLPSRRLSRAHRERLVRAGFLQEVVKGWLMVASPGVAEGAESSGSSTLWYASFWAFLRQYLTSRFEDNYCLAPEASLLRHVESTLVPAQVIAVTRTGSNQLLSLPHSTSLLTYQDVRNFPSGRIQQAGLWLMNLPTALCRLSPAFFLRQAPDVEIALRLLRDPAPLLRVLLTEKAIAAAGRLAGGYAALGETGMAQSLMAAMRAAGHTVRPVNPFQDLAGATLTTPTLPTGLRITHPAAARIQSLWGRMRPAVLDAFPPAPGLPADPAAYLAQVQERYRSDAYHSLSIEGYRVTPELIERVREGRWDTRAAAADLPEISDRQHSDALAARGYFQAFQEVQGSLRRILSGENAGRVVAQDHPAWYREMFAPAAVAGLLPLAALAGYRGGAVYLRGSRHVPPSSEAVLDCLDTLFGLLADEPEASVRGVLGHFLFVYIHPYPDGNGRIGRFLMNALLASGGYPWTIIHQERRREYMTALEAASVGGDIGPFAEFVRGEMTAQADE